MKPKPPKRLIAATTGITPANDFRSVIASIHADVDGELFRISALNNIKHLWKPFTTAWAITAGKIGLGNDVVDRLPPDMSSLADRIFWTWSMVESSMTPLVLCLDEATSLSTAEIVHTIRIMQVSSLIFADGSLHPALTRRLNNTVQADESRLAAELNKNLLLTATYHMRYQKLTGAK